MITLTVVLVTLLVVGLLVGNYFFSIALDPKNDWYKRAGRKMIYSTDVEQGGKITDTARQQTEATDRFYKECVHEEEYIQSYDGLCLFGTVFLPHPESRNWAILMHGYRSNGKADCGYVASRLADLGFNSIVPDQRGSGKSQGTSIGMGWPERFDVVTWIEHVLARNPEAEVILYGGSMGASTVMNACGEKLPANVRMIIADCGYSSVAKLFDYLLKHAMKIPIPQPVVFFADIITQAKAGYSLYGANTAHQLEKNQLPILFIHGTADSFVPYEMTVENMEATKAQKEALFVEDAVHFSSYVYNPELYFDTVESFIAKNL
jgi:fermentation-respiration switch protein FrsA (DUF1100 family)